MKKVIIIAVLLIAFVALFADFELKDVFNNSSIGADRPQGWLASKQSASAGKIIQNGSNKAFSIATASNPADYWRNAPIAVKAGNYVRITFDAIGKGMINTGFYTYTGFAKYFPAADSVRTITLNGEKQKIVLEFTVKNGTKGQICDNIRPFFRIEKNTEVTIENYCVSVSAAAPVKKAKVLPLHNDAAMDFDFKGVRGKKEFSDRTGKFRLFSDTAPMLEEDDSLRVSDSSRLRIPCPDNAFGEKVTISMWYLNTASTWTWEIPLLERGVQEDIPWVAPYQRKTGKYDFTLYLVQEYPGFVIGRTGFDKVGTEGIVAFGMQYSNSRNYYNRHYPNWPAKIHIDPVKTARKNHWQHITAVYDHGATAIYIDGKLVVSAPTKRKEKFLTSGMDLVIGAFRNESDLNKLSGELLVKSLTVTPRVLSDKEIADTYAAESRIMEVDRGRPNLRLTRHYYSNDQTASDPGLKKVLEITEKYKKNKPEDPYIGNKNMTSRYTEDGVLEINGRKYPSVMANMYNWEQSLPRREIVVGDFAAAGVDAIAFNLGKFWLGENKYDWGRLDKLLKMYVDQCPTVKIKVVVSLSVPEWFRKKYPEELEKHALGLASDNPKLSTWNSSEGLLGSDKFKAASEKMLAEVIRYCEKSPYANHIYAYQIFGGAAGEWYWPGLFAKGGTTGYSEPTRQCLIKYLRKKYNNNTAALRKAWNDPVLEFETVKMPTPKRRTTSQKGIFRDPAVTQDITDVRNFLHERTKECFQDAVKTVKKHAPNKIIGIYNGYLLLYAPAYTVHFSGMQTLGDTFRTAEVSHIATPIDYGLRRFKNPGVNINGFNGSAALHGKKIWREEDSTTHLTNASVNSRAGSLRETLEVKRRALGYTMAGNYGFWYTWQMPLHGYHQNEVMEEIARMQNIAVASVKRSRKSVAQVALVVDEGDSILYTNPTGYTPTMQAYYWDLYRELHNSGIAFDTYFTDDLDDPDMPDYKMYIFMNQWACNDKTFRKIKNKLKRNNAFAVYQYAPSFMFNAAFAPEKMKALTGIDFDVKVKTMTFNTEHLVCQKSPLMKEVKIPEAYRISPVFSAKKGKDVELLATARGLNVMAKTKNSFWSMLPLNIQLIRNLCREKGIHIYSTDNNTLLVNESYLMVHTLKNGPFTVTLPKEFFVTELLSGKKFGKTSVIKDDLQAGTTRIYSLETK